MHGVKPGKGKAERGSMGGFRGAPPGMRGGARNIAWSPAGGWASVEQALLAAWRNGLPVGGKGPGQPTPPTEEEYRQLARALLSLQRGLTGDRALVGERYMDEAKSFAAYLLYYWPASFAQATRALVAVFAGPFARTLPGSTETPVAGARAESPEGKSPGGRPLEGKRVLDLGSGPGPAGAAALALGASSLLCLEPSARARDTAKQVLERVAPDADFDAHPWSFGQELPRENAYDLIIISHMINEVGREGDRFTSRLAFLDALRGSLAPEGVLLVIEPALLSTSRDLIALRDAMVGPAGGWNCLAPCLFSGPCPALAAGPAQTCHDAFAWKAPRFVDELASRAGLDRGELKSCWFAFVPRQGGSGKTAAADTAGETRPYRVVSDPMLNKAGKTRYFLCGASGRKSLSARLGSLPPSCAGFSALRRGDYLRAAGIGDDEKGEADSNWSIDGASSLERMTGWW